MRVHACHFHSPLAPCCHHAEQLRLLSRREGATHGSGASLSRRSSPRAPGPHATHRTASSTLSAMNTVLASEARRSEAPTCGRKRAQPVALPANRLPARARASQWPAVLASKHAVLQADDAAGWTHTCAHPWSCDRGRSGRPDRTTRGAAAVLPSFSARIGPSDRPRACVPWRRPRAAA